MKLIASPKCLRDSMSPLIIANYLMGLRASDGPCYRPAFILIVSLIYFLILLSAYITALYFQQELFSRIKLLKLEYIMYELIIYVHSIAVIYKMFLGRYYTKTFDTCYRDIFKIDETLQHLGSKLNYGKLYFIIIITMLLWFIFISSTAYLTILNDHVKNMRLEIIIYIIVLRSYGLTVNFITVLEFVIFVRCIQIRFRLINRLLHEGLTISLMQMNPFIVQDCVRKIKQVKDTFPIETLPQLDWQLQSRAKMSISSKPICVKLQVAETGISFQLQKQCQIELQGQSRNNSSIVMKYRKRKHLLQIIKQVHLALCKVSKKLCAVFGVQISLGIAFTVIMVTGVLYNIYLQFSRNLGNTRNIFVQLLMAITYSLELFFLNYVCKNAADEGNKTAEIIHAAYKHNPDADIQEEIHQFGLQISQSSVKFFAAGLPLDYNILTSYLKAITTYLVIIIEMSNSLELKNAERTN